VVRVTKRRAPTDVGKSASPAGARNGTVNYVVKPHMSVRRIVSPTHCQSDACDQGGLILMLKGFTDNRRGRVQYSSFSVAAAGGPSVDRPCNREIGCRTAIYGRSVGYLHSRTSWLMSVATTPGCVGLVGTLRENRGAGAGKYVLLVSKKGVALDDVRIGLNLGK
jgi:hypothetical protein